MLTEPQRQTILELHQTGMGIRQISRTLGHARHTIRRVLSEGSSLPPQPTTGVPPALSSRLPELFCTARGNVVRIQELLREHEGLEVPYSTLTYWVRQLQLREPVPHRAGHYEFAPGQEMQHDTSPHRLAIGGQVLVAQCAGLILGFSHYAFIQYYPAFTRFEAQVFLNAGFGFFGGTARRCTIDNTSVLVAAGSGPGALIAAPMVRFDEVVVCFAGQIVARHPRAIGQRDRRTTAKGHHRPLGARTPRPGPAPQQQALLQDAPPVLKQYIEALVTHAPGRGTARLKRLLQLKRTYPTEPFLGALEQALAYGLFDLNRLEALMLKRVRGDFFRLADDED